MKMYGNGDLPTLYDVEDFLYVQEDQLDIFRQELIVSNVSVNVAQTNQQLCSVHYGFFVARGRGQIICGKSYGIDLNSIGN